MENKDNQRKDYKRWFAMSNQEIFEKLNTDPIKGLTSEQVSQKLKEEGQNKLAEAKETPIIITFLKTLIDPLAIIMLFAGFLSILLPLILIHSIEQEEIPGIIVIFGVVFTNSIIGTWQEVKAHKSLNALKSMAEPKAVVLRDGKQVEINVEDIVRGDIVYLETGKFIPADIRIIESPKLKVDESVLTGESLPVEKTTDTLANHDTILGDQINIGFMSTYITDGRAVGVVIATGEYSAVGRIAQSIASTKQVRTPLQKKLTQLAFWISIISAFFGIGIFLLEFFTTGSRDDGKALISSIIFSISASIALIPESIMIIVTISLSVSAKKMASRNVIIKTFNAIETLGTVNVICSDKTGTLTQNKMTVEKLFLNNEIIDLKKFKYVASNEQIWHFANGFILCSDAISEDDAHIGDPTELALTDWTSGYNLSEIKIRKKYPRIDEIPFDSERKIMTTVQMIHDIKTVYVKGALDRLLDKCNSIYLKGEIVPLTEEIKQEIIINTQPLLEDALRVLGLAVKEIVNPNKNDKENYEQDLVFIGCAAMMDPPRKEAKLAVKRANDSGVRVIMITGDHKITALAIAKRIGIATLEFSEALTGAEIDLLNDTAFKEKLKTVNVFARVNPEHKTRIVEILQSEGKIVAMTGDGVNDSPSLAKANIGIAMGIAGTDVAKEAAKAILTDDNFATIISGVREGRNVYEKIKRSIAFLLGANFAQILMILFILAFSAITKQRGTIVALGGINVLWHIMLVETLLAIPFGLAHSKEWVMMHQPRNSNESVFKWILVEIISITLFNTVFAIIAFLIAYYGIGADVAATISVDEINQRIKLASLASYIVIINAPVFYAWITQTRNYTVKVPKDRMEKLRLNEALLVAMIIAILLNVITLFIPGLNQLFNVPEMNDHVGAVIGMAFVLSFLPFLLKWAENSLYRKIFQSLHHDLVKVSKFDFAKKQKRDKIKQIKKKMAAKIEKLQE